MRRAIGPEVTALGHPSSLLPGPPRPPRITESGPRDSLSKVTKLAALEKRIARHRAQGERIVHCHGCFDVVHPGHLRYLQFARTQGDILVVSLTSDDAIEKEDGIRPHVPQGAWSKTSAAAWCSRRATSFFRRPSCSISTCSETTVSTSSRGFGFAASAGVSIDRRS